MTVEPWAQRMLTFVNDEFFRTALKLDASPAIIPLYNLENVCSMSSSKHRLGNRPEAGTRVILEWTILQKSHFGPHWQMFVLKILPGIKSDGLWCNDQDLRLLADSYGNWTGFVVFWWLFTSCKNVGRRWEGVYLRQKTTKQKKLDLWS